MESPDATGPDARSPDGTSPDGTRTRSKPVDAAATAGANRRAVPQKAFGEDTVRAPVTWPTAERSSLERLAAAASAFDDVPVEVAGVVDAATVAERRVRGISLDAALGDRLEIAHGDGSALAEVVRIDREHCTAALYERRASAFLGAPAVLRGPFALRPHEAWLGRTVDALGRPLDGSGPLPRGAPRSCDADPPPALARPPLTRPLRTGVKSIDLFAPLVEGQRIGIFAGSGVGKSTLLGMLAAAASVDVVVAALVGERGREVGELLSGPLAPHRARTIAVVSTGDETALMRRQAARTAVTVAEYFRDGGARVLLLVDSLTRAAHAMRDVALSAGEPPVSRGFPPAVFSELARLAERAGQGGDNGSITAAFCVLVESDDLDDPIADAARGTLDGHIVLSRALAEAGRFPAVDPLASLSRLSPAAFTADEAELSRQLRRLIARYEDTRDLRLLGAHQPGTDPELDRAVALVPRIAEALVQRPGEPPSRDAFAELADVLSGRSADAPQGVVQA